MSGAINGARVLPHDLQAERALLGAIMIRPDVLYDVAAHVGPGDCFRDAHQRIFRHILLLSDAKVVIDPLTLGDSLTRTNELDEVGGPIYLFGLTDGVPHSTHAVDYARIVRQKFQLRQIIIASQRTLAEAYDAEHNAADVLDAAQAGLMRIAGDQVTGGGLVGMRAVMRDVMDELEQRAKDRRPITGMPTGLTTLDAMTRGFQKQDLVVIGARPSVGKTSLAMNIAEHAGVDAEARVAVFSLEMGCRSLGVRLLASAAGIDHARLMTGHISEAEWSRVSVAMSRLAESGLYVDESSSTTVFDVRAKARRLKAECGRLDLIIIDYLQLMRGTEHRDNKNLELAEISRSLKMIAKDLDVPLVLLSQLSRASEQRSNHRPQLSDLRDTGALEQDADVVLFIHREEKYGTTPENAGVAEIIVAKQRNGPTGAVRVTFVDHLMRFANFEPSGDRVERARYGQ